MKNFTDKYLFTYSRGDRMMPVSNPHYVYKKRFLWERPLIIFLLILISILLLSCSPKEVESTRSKVPVEHSKHIYVRHNDGRIEYLGPVESIPYLVDIEHDNRLSREENLEIIRADGNRLTKKNQSASSDFQFEGFDRVIHHRDYVGILTGNRVMVPVYREYQTTYFAYGLIIFSIIYFVSFFSITILFKRKFKLLWSNGWEERGSLNLYLGQLFLSITFILFLLMVILTLIFGISHEFANFVGLVFLYTLGTIGPIAVILWIGSNSHSSEKSLISLIILGIINFLLWYFADITEYIFYVTLIPACLGIILGIMFYGINKRRYKFPEDRELELERKNKKF